MSTRRVLGIHSEPARAACRSGEHPPESLPRRAFSRRWLPHGLSWGRLLLAVQPRLSKGVCFLASLTCSNSTSPAVSPWERPWGPGRAGLRQRPAPRKNTSLPVLFLWAGGGGCWTALWIDCHCDIGMVVPAGLVSGEPGGRTFSRCSFSSLGSTQRVRHSHTFPTTTHAPHLFLITFFH